MGSKVEGEQQRVTIELERVTSPPTSTPASSVGVQVQQQEAAGVEAPAEEDSGIDEEGAMTTEITETMTSTRLVFETRTMSS